jgi:nucleoside-diphosphate-sugar epimerase
LKTQITGATGLIGFRVVVEALQSGYHVRAAVRSQAKADAILATRPIKDINPGSNLSFALVPDIIVEDAYDEAVKGAKYIIHVASPVPNPTITYDFESQIIQPAVLGTVGILNSARKTSGVKRIIITSSNGGVVAFADLLGLGSGEIFTGDHRVPADNGPFQHAMQAYCASKVKALLATDEFFASNMLEFDHVNIMPCVTIGRNELATTPEEISSSSNGVIMRIVLGVDAQMPLPGSTVHLDDVAKIHVLALDSDKVAGGSNFLAASGGVEGIQFNDYKAIVERNFSKAVEDGTLPNSGDQPTTLLRFDVSNTEKVFALKFRSYEDQVTSLVAHYLELVKST